VSVPDFCIPTVDVIKDNMAFHWKFYQYHLENENEFQREWHYREWKKWADLLQKEE
jgi:hypothetical protein